MISHMFPGQGSQHTGMGKELFDRFPEYTCIADDILGYSIKQLCLEENSEKLNSTEYTQPALFVVNALSYLKSTQDLGVHPDYLIGHSLGEYNALFCAGVFDFTTGVYLTKTRGTLMSKVKDGAMAAIIGVPESCINEVIEKYKLKNVFIANLNAPSKFSISGSRDEILCTMNHLEYEKQAICVSLNVSGAFHSPAMEDVKSEFMSEMNSIVFNSPTIPVISNVTAKPYQKGEVKSLLCEQITSPVKWIEGIEYLLAEGVLHFQEIGPGNTLKSFLNRIKSPEEYC